MAMIDLYWDAYCGVLDVCSYCEYEYVGDNEYTSKHDDKIKFCCEDCREIWDEENKEDYEEI